jgi:diguanylate cyclase (GGDEF)-like protein
MTRVLVIDDTAFMREEISELLRFEGIDVLTAEDGTQGLELALRELPDLILCDVMMPGLDGYQVLTELRRLPATSLIPFIFMTVLHDREAIRRGMNLGADDYLEKPMQRHELLAAVRSRLQRHEALRQRFASDPALQAPKPDDSARYDPLTGLPNRRLLPDWLGREIRSCQAGWLLGVMILDIDRFQAVHNALGPKASDELIRVLSERLRGHDVPPETTLFRSGESELALLMPRLADEQAVRVAAARLLQAVRRPIPLERHTLHMTASLGIALYPIHGEDPETLLAHASLAAQDAREHGGNNVQTFQASLKERVFTRLSLETHLRQALQRKALSVHFQPQIELQSGRIVGLEALARWEDPELGPIPPGEFVPIAEQCGLIPAIGAFILHRACIETRAFHDMGFSDLSVAVNVSSEQFQQGQSLTEDVVRALTESGLDPSCLHLELTESAIMRDPVETAVKLRALKVAGVRVALDDFGTGYSSLAYLKSFPLDTLKIDQSFIRDITDTPEAAAITAAIIELGHRLGLAVLAEGVETAEQAALLQSQGCDVAQGYHFGGPLPPTRLLEWLHREWRPGDSPKLEPLEAEDEILPAQIDQPERSADRAASL